MKCRSLFAFLGLTFFPAIATAQEMAGSPADKANMKAMERMHQAMPTKGSGNADKDFILMMVPHHQGAIDMAKVEMQFGKDPALKKMAEKIVKDQEREIGEMRAEQKRLEKK